MNYSSKRYGTLALVAVALIIALAVAFVPEAQVLAHQVLTPDGVLIGMTTLAVNRSRSFELGDYNDLPVIASDIIWEGAAVGDNGTNAFRPLTGGDIFKGFAEAKADNSAGAAAAVNVRVRAKGRVQLPISSFDVTDVDKPVYASDDDTFSLSESTNSYIGRAIRFVATGTCIVAFDADHPSGGRLVELVDNSAGTADGTIAVIGGTYVQAEVRNAIADIAAKVNSLIRMTQN